MGTEAAEVAALAALAALVRAPSKAGPPAQHAFAGQGLPDRRLP